MSDDHCLACPVPGSDCLLKRRGQCHHAEREVAVRAKRPYAETPYTDRAIVEAGGRADAPPIVFVHKTYKRHHGLGVNADQSVRALGSLGFRAGTAIVDSEADIRRAIGPETRLVVIQGAWLPAGEIIRLAEAFPGVKFVCRCHSGLGFLWAEPDVLPSLRALAAGPGNLIVSGVSKHFADWFTLAYRLPCTWLPNLIDLGPEPDPRPADGSGPLNVCSFGATRPQKHHMVAAGVAVELARRLDRPVRFHLNAGRNEGGSESALRSMMAGVEGVELVDAGWLDHDDFTNLCRSMHLGLQLSSTETFNIVTADLAALGTPSVVGQCIDWMPGDMFGPIDDAAGSAAVAIELLADPTAGLRARAALAEHQRSAEDAWRAFLAPPAAPREPVRRSATKALAEVQRAKQCAHRVPCGCASVDCALHGRGPANRCIGCPDWTAAQPASSGSG
jgi:hypothetical protein